MDKKKDLEKKNNEEAKKTAYNNQWTNTSLDHYQDETECRDGPGGN